jgi:hypothetical protein
LYWWDDLITRRPKKEQCATSGRLLYVLWNAWKKNETIVSSWLTYIEVASVDKEDILQRERDFTAYVPVILAKSD